MTRRAQIERYVAQVLELDTLKQQLERFPELKGKPGWSRDFDMASVRVAEYYRCLRGSDLGEANRMLKLKRMGRAPLGEGVE